MATADSSQITVLVIPADDPAHLLRLTPDLTALQTLVGGFLQQVPLPRHAVMYLNEEGKAEGLSPNLHATVLARHLNAGLAPDDVIVGTVVVLGVVSSTGAYDGEEHDVPPEIVEECRTIGIHVDDLSS